MENVINTFGVRNIRALGGGLSIGQTASTPMIYGGQEMMSQNAMPPSGTAKKANGVSRGNSEVDNAVEVGLFGQPVIWYVGLVAGLIGLMWLPHKYGSAEVGFANVKFTVYNLIVITLTALLGKALLKIAFTKFPVPGLSTLVLGG